MMIDVEIAEDEAVEPWVRRLLANPKGACIHAPNAKRAAIPGGSNGRERYFAPRAATTAPPTIAAQANPSDGVAEAKPAATRMSVDSTGAA